MVEAASLKRFVDEGCLAHVLHLLLDWVELSEDSSTVLKSDVGTMAGCAVA